MRRRLCALLSLALPACAGTPTFSKDVLPILATRCQECHRKGEIGPMQLMTYQQARPWAKSIKEAVLSKKMPPWFADPHFGRFSNDRSLSRAEIDTLAAWADGGAPEGEANDKPAPRAFVDGWNIAEPDTVIEMPNPFPVPATGKIDYQYIVLPTKFTEDKWVQMVELRPTNHAVVHHAVVFIREPGSRWLRDAEPGVPITPPDDPRDRLRNIGGGGSEILTIYTPGMVPDIWHPGLAKQIKAGSDLVLQMHYTANGTAAADRTKIGIVFAKEPPTERVLSLSASNFGFTIPPGDPNYKVEARIQTVNECRVLSLFPHMHLRGKAMTYEVTYPGGETETLLNVPKYEFNWQLSYKLEKPLLLPPGTKVHVSGYFDNSPNNPSNPDPSASVRFGEQSWEEMMIGFMDVSVDVHLNRRNFYSRRPAASE